MTHIRGNSQKAATVKPQAAQIIIDQQPPVEKHFKDLSWSH